LFQSVKKTGFLLSDSVFPGSQSLSLPQFWVAWLGRLRINNLDMSWVSSDSLMTFLIHSFHRLTVNTVLNVLTELLSVSFFIVFLQFFHVLSDVSTEDVFAVGFSVEFVFVVVVTRESLGGVWDVKATVDGSFQGAENFVSGGGSGETGVEEASEWTWTVVGWLYVVFVTIDFFLSLVEFVELHLGEKSSGEEETGAVVSGVVGEAGFDSEFWEFVGVSGSDNNITTHPWVSNLANNIPVSRSNNQSVFWGVELVLVLSAESSPGLVIGFTFLSPLEFWLKSFEVGLVFLDLDQSVNSLLSSVSVLSGHFRLLMSQFFSVSST